MWTSKIVRLVVTLENGDEREWEIHGDGYIKLNTRYGPHEEPYTVGEVNWKARGIQPTLLCTLGHT